jgi:hypothetical protein
MLVKVRKERVRDFQAFAAHSPWLSRLTQGHTPGFRQAWTFAGVGCLEVGDKASGALQGAGLRLRLDFNPQNVPLEALVALGRMVHGDSVVVTRADVALDYLEDLTDCLVSHDTARKSGTFSDRGTCQTWYFGSGRSDRYFRVYNKAAEREDKGLSSADVVGEGYDGPLWRLECESRPHGGEVLGEALFDGLQVRNVPASARQGDDLTVTELAVLLCCLEQPDFLKRFSDRKTRKKYRALLESVTASLDPSPQEVYQEARPLLQTDLAFIEMALAGHLDAVAWQDQA